MPTASGRGSTSSRASALPTRAVAAPATTAPLSKDRREMLMISLLPGVLLGVGRDLLGRHVARAHEGADDGGRGADDRGGDDAMVRVDGWVRAGGSRALDVHRVVERHAGADLLLGAAGAGGGGAGRA